MRLIVFDVDGTLVDSQRHIHAAMIAAYATEELDPPSLDAVRNIVGLSLPEAVALLAPDLALERQIRIVMAYKAGFGQIRHEERAQLYPGARDCIERLAAQSQVVLGVATGKSRRGLDHLLVEHDLQGRFMTRQVADDHPSKPHPSMLMTAMRETGVDAQNSVMIGDTIYDIEMGVAAGMATIGVAWGYHDATRLRQAGADRIVASFADLETELTRVWND